MTSSDLPPTPPESSDAPTGIQTSPETPSAPSIPLPPLPNPPAMSVEKFTGIRGGLDRILVALVLAFAFLVASFPVTNPDFFRHLATGRLLAQGDYHFGVDPFTYTSAGVYWVDHSWLFALLVYALYQIPTIGGIVVVVAKALLVVALAGIMLRVGRRAGQSLWIPAACTALALLALSPRLYLQPVCLSLLFLALTLWLLDRPRRLRVGQAFQPDGRESQAGKPDLRRSWWLIPPLFALWVNCDAWFFVGPLTVALYLVGELLQHWYPPAGEERDASGRRRLGTLALVLIVGLAACLLNPHHIHVFTLPPELGLSPAADLIEHDAQFRTLFLSPLRKAYYDPYLGGLSVAGLAYPPLLILGAVSFGFVFGWVPGWRLSVWLGFALLSLYNVRAIAFFAIVAGPITALNWLDYAAHRLGRDPLLTPGWRRWSLGGRALTILLALVLLAATVPGWLQARPHDSHRVGWGVRVDPSLEQAARQIKTWSDEGRLPADARWFNLHQEIANYLAWFAPGQRAFFDQRIPQFRAAAEDYLAIRAGLGRLIPDKDAPAEGPESGSPDVARDWPNILRKRGVQFWIIDQISASKADQVAPWLLFGNPLQWKLCYLHGRVAIFAWEDPLAKTTANPSPKRLDLQRVAFGAEAEQAPAQGPETVMPPRSWWEVWWRPKPPIPLDQETAKLHAIRFGAMQPQLVYDHSRDWQEAVAAGTVGNALPQGPLPNCLLALNVSWSQTYADLFPTNGQQPARQPDKQRDQDADFARLAYVRGQDAGPPDSLYLAIRAARRALAANPEDSESYLQLGWTYARLREATQEGRLTRASPLLADIRQTQMVAAYQNCLRCQPHPRNAAKAHEALYSAFQQRYWDLAAYHLRELRNSRQAAGPLPDESPEKFAQTLEAISKTLMPLEEEVKRRQDQYEVHAANKPVLEKVRIALEKGLAETALNTMEQAASGDLSGLRDVSIVSQMMGLFLDIGRLDKAGDLLVPEPELAGKPVPLHYLDFHVRLAAARGDYAEADRHLNDALNHTWKDPSGRPARLNGEQVVEQVGRVLLAEAQRLGGVPRIPSLVHHMPSDFWVRRWRLEALEVALFDGQQRADWYLLRGWLALEVGRCVEARQYFRIVLDSVVPPARWIPEVNRLNALFDPREMQILQQLPVRQNVAQALSQHYLKWLDASQR